MPPEPPRLHRRQGSEIDPIWQYFPTLARIVNAHSEKLRIPDRVEDLPQMTELLDRLLELFAIQQEKNAATFLTLDREPSLLFSRQLFAGSGITLTDQGKLKKLIIAATGAGTFPPMGLDVSYQRDDFCGGGDLNGAASAPDYTENASVGELGWSSVRPTVPGTNVLGWTELGQASSAAEQAEHPGILYLGVPVPGVGETGIIRLSLPVGAGTNPVYSVLSIAKTFHQRFVLNAYQIQTGAGAANNCMDQVFGMDASTLPGLWPIGVGFAYTRTFAASQTTWQLVTGNPATGADRTDSGITVDTNYHLFEILHTGGTTVYTFKIDGATVGTITYDFETALGTQWIVPTMALRQTDDAVDEKFMAVDLYDCLTEGLARYTPA